MADVRQRHPRVLDRDYKGWIAGMPCVACWVAGKVNKQVHVAHLRMACHADGLTLTGKSEKPDDWRTTPLCPAHHMYDRDSQHKVGEEVFWARLGINPADLCRALYAAFLANQSGLAVIAKFTGEAIKSRIRL